MERKLVVAPEGFLKVDPLPSSATVGVGQGRTVSVLCKKSDRK